MSEFDREFVLKTLGQLESNSPGACAEIIFSLYEVFLQRGQTDVAGIIKEVVIDWHETGQASPPEFN